MNDRASAITRAGSPLSDHSGKGASRARRVPFTGPSRVEGAVCLFGIVMGCVAALSFWLRRGSLWEDEIIAITHMNQPLPGFFIELLRNDFHPPTWFLQLDAWLALGANTDRWALANSLLLAAFSLGMLFFVARATHGLRAAWFATALFAVLPSFAWSAGTLRMYALIPGLAVLVYHANRRWFATRAGAWLAAVVALELVLICTHAIEFYFVAFILLAVLVERAVSQRDQASTSWSGVGAWLVAQLAVGLVALAIAVSALARASDASAPESILEFLGTPGGLIAGWKFSSYAFARLAGTVVFVVLAVAALAERSARVRTIVIPLGALLIATLVGIAFKPMYKQPVFAANLLPFLALGAGAGAALGTKGVRIAVMACIVVLAIAALPIVREQAQGEAYGPAGRYLKSHVQRGDVVVVPNVSVYWGVMRYAVGPDWGKPLETMTAPNPQWRRLMDSIDAKAGAGTADRLGLIPSAHHIDHDGVRYVIGDNARLETAGASRVWIVRRDRYAVDVMLDPRFASSPVEPPVWFENELFVQRLEAK